MAGQVEAVGRNVTQFKAGDEVFGACIRDPQDSALRVWIPQGAFAEYACAPESALVMKPDNARKSCRHLGIAGNFTTRYSDQW